MTIDRNWRKLGRVYVPSGAKSWARSHAANPTAVHLGRDIYRIYFSTRDGENRSNVGSVDLDITQPTRIVDESPKPVLLHGELGMFDDSGASIGCITTVGEAQYLYYMGWNLAVTVPWKNQIGLAISKSPGEPFVRHSRFPIIHLDETDPYSLSYPWVVWDQGRFRMWYGSNLKWGSQARDMVHVIKYAESDDGVRWQRHNEIAIDAQLPEEYALSRPCVVKDDRGYTMWFCGRGDAYRIESARSEDGNNWQRLGPTPTLEPSANGWDARMVEYPCVFDHGHQRYMLYSGDEFGKTGFGIAVQDRA